MRRGAFLAAILLSACSTDGFSVRPALVFVVDAAGDVDLLRRACVVASKELGAGDDVGVLAFDVRPTWVVELGPAGRDLSASLAALKPGGGSDLPRALVEAARAFGARARGHVVVVSDGDTVDAGLEAAVRALAEKGVTVSAVCVGVSPRFDAPLMSRVAEWGRGRFIFTPASKDLPKILPQEARWLLR